MAHSAIQFSARAIHMYSGYRHHTHLRSSAIYTPNSLRERGLKVLKAYFDDSGSHSDSNVVVLGGLIGTVEQWHEFDALWKAKLAAPLPGRLPLRMFHLSHCQAATGEFLGYTLAERDAVTHDFRKIIIDLKLISFAAAIDRKAWNDLVISPYRAELGEDIGQCVCRCIEETNLVAQSHPQGDEIVIVFDEGMWNSSLEQLTVRYTYHMGRPWVKLITKMKVIEATPLQGADIVVTENYWHALDWLKLGDSANVRPHFRHYLSNMITEGVIVDRSAIADLLKCYGRDGRPLLG